MSIELGNAAKLAPDECLYQERPATDRCWLFVVVIQSSLLTLDQIERARDVIYRRMPRYRIRRMDDAAQFIDAVGFSLLFASTQAVELPSLFEAVKGRRDAHINDWDKDSDRVWVWKNDLPAARRAYYGKALAGGKPVFVSLKMLPYLYALNASDDLGEEYRRGQVSLEAKRIYDALRERGPVPTMMLRMIAGLDRASDTMRYHHALEELQRRMAILPVGATIERGAWPSQIFELVERWFPRQVARAHRLQMEEARRALVRRYMQTVIACPVSMIGRVFGWPRDHVLETVEDLVRRRILVKQKDWIIRNAR